MNQWFTTCVPYRRTPRTQQRIDTQRRAIVDAATEQLAESGYGGCSVAAVAARAGVATGTVYRHFAGKAELVVELFTDVVGHEVAAVRGAGDEPGTPAERVCAVLETFAARALKRPRQAYALLVEPVDAPVEEQRLAFRRAYRDVLARLIADGVRSGSLPAQDAELTAAALVGATAEILTGPLDSGNAADIPELRRFARRSLGDTPQQESPTDGSGTQPYAAAPQDTGATDA